MALFNAIEEKPKGTRFESQENAEKLYFILRRHPITNIGWMLGVTFLVALPLFIMLFVPDQVLQEIFKIIPTEFQIVLFITWYILTLFFAFESFILWYFNVYIITNKRLIDVDFYGFWRKRISETGYDSVEDATYETTKFLHVLFDYGNISMQTAAEKREFEFNSVPQPSRVHDKLTDLVEAYKKKYGAK